MAVVSALSFPQSFVTGLDELLFQVCEEVQLTTARYDLAVERYNTLNKMLEGSASPFRHFLPEIYPQGSMALGTTVKPISGPHDLDFVLQLSRHDNAVDPMALIRTLYTLLRTDNTYRSMTSLKNRCVRLEYADDFYMDVLPACRNSTAGGTCVKVPDRNLKGWSDSNPLGYINWFKRRSRLLLVERMFDKAAAVPEQQAVGEKRPLELVVQLIKRWRDLYYAGGDPDLAPISIVLTTLAGHAYNGEQSVSKALTFVLEGIIRYIDDARGRGCRLHVPNPSNEKENLSERWDANPSAYLAFEKGMREFRRLWVEAVAKEGNVNQELEVLFGEPVRVVLKKRATRAQGERLAGRAGVTAKGLITAATSAVVSVRPNTFYGAE